MIKKPLQRKPQKPVRETKHRVANPRADFARQSDMITDAEYQAILEGNAALTEGTKAIMNLNAKLTFPTGTKETLYPGRGSYLMVKTFLEN